MSTTAIFYSPEGGSVDRIAHQVGSMIGEDRAKVFHVKELKKDQLDQHEQIILVGSTVGADHWDNEVIEDEWIEFFSKFEEKEFEGKKLAVIGLGNCVLYPEHFADDMAILFDKATQQGAQTFGSVDASGYDFTDSAAVNQEGFFCGLALDEDNEYDLTEERLENWIQALSTDFEF